MLRAIQLADLANGLTSPNPLVGAIVLDKNGVLVGEGFHARAGLPHAEVQALAQAGKAADQGTLVVTLEPCCHFGKTPPCTELILQSGLSQVVIGLQDPDPRVAGRGISLLKESGIKVLTGILADEIAFQNRAFLFRLRTGRPWGILKWAMSFDGRIGLTNGKSKWISCESSRLKVHSLRAKCDAVIVGGGTVRADDPLLTTRGLRNPEPKRIIFSSSLKLPKNSKIFSTELAETMIAFDAKSDQSLLKELPPGPEQLPLSPANPTELLKSLALKGCNRVLWECGPLLATSAIKHDCVQEIVCFIAPKLLGGEASMNPLAELGFDSMDKVLGLNNVSLGKVGKDFVLNVHLKESK